MSEIGSTVHVGDDVVQLLHPDTAREISDATSVALARVIANGPAIAPERERVT